MNHYTRSRSGFKVDGPFPSQQEAEKHALLAVCPSNNIFAVCPESGDGEAVSYVWLPSSEGTPAVDTPERFCQRRGFAGTGVRGGVRA